MRDTSGPMRRYGFAPLYHLDQQVVFSGAIIASFLLGISRPGAWVVCGKGRHDDDS